MSHFKAKIHQIPFLASVRLFVFSVFIVYLLDGVWQLRHAVQRPVTEPGAGTLIWSPHWTACYKCGQIAE